MADDVLINKAATIERCVARAREEYHKNPDTFVTDFTRQDAAILNIQRACEAALDLSQHLVRRERLGVPQGARNLFDLLARGGWIEPGQADKLKPLVGFRNIAVQDYQAMQWPIIVRVITCHLDDLLEFSQRILQQDGRGSSRGDGIASG